MIYGIIAIILIAVMLIYFRIAVHYNIIDHPNEEALMIILLFGEAG